MHFISVYEADPRVLLPPAPLGTRKPNGTESSEGAPSEPEQDPLAQSATQEEEAQNLGNQVTEEPEEPELPAEPELPPDVLHKHDENIVFKVSGKINIISYAFLRLFFQFLVFSASARPSLSSAFYFSIFLHFPLSST